MWVLNVDHTVPCPSNEAIREPYPRALVTKTNYFVLLSNEWAPSEAGLWSPPQDVMNLIGKVDADGEPLEADLVRRVQFGLRAQRLPKDTVWLGDRVPDVNWTFTGPASDGSARVQAGYTATFAYAASSYDGPNTTYGAVPNTGRRFDFASKLPGNQYDLPAFPVKLTTYCGFWQSVRGEMSVPYWQRLGECFNAERDPITNEIIVRAGFSAEGCPNGQVAFGRTAYRWQQGTIQEWTRLDMRRLFGLPYTYVTWERATAGGIFKNRRYMEPANAGIYVPVVEVQTVQEDP